jgi:hypothetical protein
MQLVLRRGLCLAAVPDRIASHGSQQAYSIMIAAA